MHFIRVDLPTPFLPTIPTFSPFRINILILSINTLLPIYFDPFSIDTMSCEIYWDS